MTLADLDAQLGDAHDDDERPKKPKAGEDKLLGYAWPGVIGKHIEHWATRPDAREYANDDIVYTRALDHHFGDPPPGDDDSILACMVPVVRWHGFQIDIPGMKGLLAKAQAVVDNAPVNINKPGEVRGYVTAAMDETEGIILEASTKKANLEAIQEWEVAEDEPCTKCVEQTDPQCPRCGGTGVMRVRQAPRRCARRRDPRREDRRQGSGTLQQAAPGRQVPRLVRCDRHTLVTHGRGRRPESRKASSTPKTCGECSP